MRLCKQGKRANVKRHNRVYLLSSKYTYRPMRLRVIAPLIILETHVKIALLRRYVIRYVIRYAGTLLLRDILFSFAVIRHVTSKSRQNNCVQLYMPCLFFFTCFCRCFCSCSFSVRLCGSPAVIANTHCLWIFQGLIKYK